jgi:hypothetical protein
LQLFEALLDGDHIARGTRNEDIRQPLLGSPRSQTLQRRASAAVGRLLKRLHVRQLVAKISRTRCWSSPSAAADRSAWPRRSTTRPGRNSRPDRQLRKFFASCVEVQRKESKRAGGPCS